MSGAVTNHKPADPDDTGAPEPREGTSAPEEIRQLMDSLPPDSAVDLLRWNDAGPKPGYKMVRTYPAADFSPGLVARKFGGGDYRVYIRFKRDGRPSVERRDFGVDPAVKPEPEPPPAAGLPAPAPAGGPTLDRAMWELLDLQVKALTSLLTSVPRESPVELFKAAVDLVKSNQVPAAPARDPIELAAKLLDLTQGRREASGSLADVLKELPDVLETARELAGGGEGGEGLGQALVAIAHAVEKLADKEADRRVMVPAARPVAIVPMPAGAVAAAQNPVTAAPGPAPAAVEGSSPVRPPWLVFLEPLLPALLRAAAQDSDVELYAELVLDQLPEAADPYLNQLMAHPDYPSNLLRELPTETASAHQWLHRLLLAIRDELREEPAAGAGGGTDGPAE